VSDLDDFEVVGSDTVFEGALITVRKDRVRMGGQPPATREAVSHPGAVAVLALDDDGNVVLLNQYRHPVRARLDELPAGILDHPGESALDAAKRELAEEARLAADDWAVLVDILSSPGFTDEAVRVFLARGLHDVGDDGFTPEHEEASLAVYREPLAEAVRRALNGSITNASAVTGLLAAVHGRATGWRDLRPADAPWPARPDAGGTAPT
jgi:8-oxo-dGTP pyrophosphatase MutT (NUDIX family)